MSAAADTVEADGPARTFSPVVIVWLVVVGVFAFGALLVLQAYAPDLRSAQDGRAHALSKSAVGFAGVVGLLKGEGRTVLISRGPVHDRGGSGVFVLTPPAEANEGDLQKLAFQDRTVLMVLPKWVAGPDFRRPGWVQKFGAEPPEIALKPATVAIPKEDADKYTASGDPVNPDAEKEGDNAPVAPAGKLSMARDAGASPVELRPGDIQVLDRPMTMGPVDQLQTVSGEGWVPVVVDARGRGLVVKRRDWPLYVLSDPDLLNTQGIKRLDTARGAVAVLDGLRAGDGPVIFDVTLNGFKRPRSMLKLAFEPPFLSVTLVALLAASLMGWHAWARFGPLRRPDRAIALGKRALADNSAALIRLAGREPRMAPRYAAAERSAAARMVGAPRDLEPEALDAFLDRLSATRGAEARLTELVAAAARVKDNTALMGVARRLHRWRTEMTRERR